MRRALVIIGLLACAYLEFRFYPEHSYLEGESQVFVPMLERLQFPGLLSRDLVATHPVLRYTSYDEATLALTRVARLSLEAALSAQLLLARLGVLTGAFLLAVSCGTRRDTALLIAALTGFGVALPGIDVLTSSKEPVPYAMALGWIVLATGLAVKGRVMAAALTAGISLLYSPAIALPWWICIVFAAALRKQARPVLRPLLTTFAVAALLLANLAQLQPGVPGGNALFRPLTPSWLALILKRTPNVIAATWIGHEGWLFAAIAIGGMCALFRCRSSLTPAAQRFLYALLAFGLLSMPLSIVVQRFLPWAMGLHLAPARSLAAVLVVSLVAVMSAAYRAWQIVRWREGLLWSIASIALLLTPLLVREKATTDFSARSLRSLSDWAQNSTWGGSMFLFTSAGTRLDAGKFRAMALRPVYVDWESGQLSPYYQDFALEWRQRWDRVLVPRSATDEMKALLAEPIDYYVSARRNGPANVSPVFANDELAVYDARDLRTAPTR